MNKENKKTVGLYWCPICKKWIKHKGQDWIPPTYCPKCGRCPHCGRKKR